MWVMMSVRRRLARLLGNPWTLGGLGLLALIVLSIMVFPHLIVSKTAGMPRKDVLEAENAVRNTLLTGIAGSLFIVTALFTWRQIQISQEGQITDRYETAVRQLAGSTPTERIGGIYALGRIAEDSRRDEPTVVELLASFCRNIARASAETANAHSSVYLSDRLPDVQVALEVLGRAELLSPPRLDGADISGAYLGEASLNRARFAWTNLAGARFQQADLRGAIFREANLTNTNFIGADLSGADLSQADLTGADLRNANLTGIGYDERTRWPEGFDPPPLYVH